MKKPFVALAVLSIAMLSFAQGGGVPAYHSGPPAKGAKLPAILPPEQLWGPQFQHAYQKRAYALAAKIPDVIYQQPCYCYCDRIGHGSLRSCYESTHAAGCDHCLKELYFAYFEHKKGKTAKQIRAGIEKGEWQSINLDEAAQRSMQP